MDWQVPLAVAAILSLGFILLRVHPVGSTEGGTAKKTLADARARLTAAKTDEERADALAAAGDACARSRTLRALAHGYYARALKVRPSDLALLERASRGLARRPRALESLLVRRLGATPWSADPLTLALLERLHALYQGRLKSPARADMIARALEGLSGRPLASVGGLPAAADSSPENVGS